MYNIVSDENKKKDPSNVQTARLGVLSTMARDTKTHLKQRIFISRYKQHTVTSNRHVQK